MKRVIMMGTQQEAGRMNRITFFNSRQRLLMENFVYNRKKNNRIKIPPNETIPNATNVYSAPFPKTKNSNAIGAPMQYQVPRTP